MKHHTASNRFLHSTVWSIAVLLALFLANPCRAQMGELSDTQLSDVYADGFSTFTFSDGGNGTTNATALFDINTSSYITIDSLKLGYYDDGQLTNPNPPFSNSYTSGSGWDEDWTNVQIGGSLTDPTKDFKTSGEYIQSNYSNISDQTTRTLNSITFGATSATGDISAFFNSFSGSILTGDATQIADAHRIQDLNLGSPGTTRTITANNSPFSITLSLTNGYQINFGAGSTYH